MQRLAPASNLVSKTIPILIGLFLATTATLKFVEAMTGVGQFSQLWVNVLVVLFEFALGCGLVFARRRTGLWMVALITFIAFVGYNVNSIRIGQTTCGCFGALPVNVSPWGALLIDVCVLAGLFIWVAAMPQGMEWRKTISEATAFGLGFGLSALFILPVDWAFGSAEAIRAKLRGDEVFLQPAVLDFGALTAKSAAEAVVVVRNSGAAEVRIYGGTSNCSCTLIPDLPTKVRPNELRELRITLTVPAGPGEFQVTAFLWTDSSTNDTIPVVLRGRSLGP